MEDRDSQKKGFYQQLVGGRTRMILAWFFVVALGIWSRQSPQVPGIALCFLGASLRFWSSGFLRKNAKLAVGGPYAWVRNPLYLGTYFMAVGASWSTGNLIFLVATSLLFAAVYQVVIAEEEAKLERLFGQAYLLYCEQVPSFFPRLFPPRVPCLSASLQKVLEKVNDEQDARHFSWFQAWRNKAYEAYLSFLGLLAFLYLVAWLWKWF
jgi:protein-S-isoprenylcysteine O-methyltransferase Ste14